MDLYRTFCKILYYFAAAPHGPSVRSGSSSPIMINYFSKKTTVTNAERWLMNLGKIGALFQIGEFP